jgi:hypothetical protein
MHTKAQHNNTCKKAKETSARTQYCSYNSKRHLDLTEITKIRGCRDSECWCALEMLGCRMKVPRGPLIAPMGLGDVGFSIRKLQKFPLREHIGQFGVPTVGRQSEREIGLTISYN